MALRTTFERFSPAQRALVRERLARAPEPAEGDARPATRAAGRWHPLSSAQLRLWFLQEMEPESCAYNSRLALKLMGELDAAALDSALAAIVDRHAILRSRFARIDGQPMQDVGPTGAFRLTRATLEDLDADRRALEARRLVAAETQRPFDLATGPLVRGLLARLAPGEHLLVITLHHIVADGASLGIFARELAILYGAMAARRRPPLEPLPIQFTDYAYWERDRLAQPRFAEHLEFWRNELEDCPRLELPAADHDPVAGGHHARLETYLIDAAASAALTRLGREAGVSTFMLLTAALGVLLSRYSGQRQLVIGGASQNRMHAGLDRMIGLFTNLLPLRIEVRPERRFREHLAAVRDACLRAYAHQEVPFDRIVEQSRPVREGLQQPLVQVLLTVLHDRPIVDIGSLRIEQLPVDEGVTGFDLHFTMRSTGRQLAGWTRYNSQLFAPVLVRRMLAHWRRLLEAIAADPDARVGDLPLLSDDELDTIARGRNATARVFAGPATMPELLDAAATRHRDAVALTCGSASMTYGELEARASRLAWRLRRLGVGRDVPVGIYVRRSPEMIEAVWAVLKAGGAYVPLDPDHPSGRTAAIAADAGLRLVLVSAELAATAQTLGVGHLIVDADGGEVPAETGEETTARPVPLSAAYILYTSGSTGRPKGITVTHGSLVNCLRGVNEYLGVGETDTVAALTTLGFDIAAIELLLPLTAGARIVLARQPIGRDVEELRQIFSRESITVAQATPSAWRLLLAAGVTPAAGMRVVCGGEALSADLVAALTRDGARVWNGYGPTETTVYSTFCEVTTGVAPSIGRPIANTQVYVLDPGLRLVPDGARGELYIAGAGVGRGYCKLPGQTAARFLPSPFSSEPGARMYRTGDLARWRIDGALDYLGRADAQVKVRGHRIEPGEIEAVLRDAEGVAGCAVLLDTGPHGQRLVAYCVAAPDAVLSPTRLREHLAQWLPWFMVPAQFVILPALPLTANGKLDRRALPAPVAAADAAPTLATPTEARLADIWRELLHLPHVDPDANFFDCGGHSLLAMQAVLRARDEFDTALPFRALFEAPTIRSLAARIDGLRDGERPSRAPITRRRIDGQAPPPLSCAQERLWLLDQLVPNRAAYTIAGGVTIAGQLDVGALGASLEGLARRHEILRTTFPIEAGRPIQRVHPAGPVALRVVDGGVWPPERCHARAAEIARRDGRAPFDLASGPLWRVTLIRCVDGDVLCLAMHHTIADGWSLSVLFRELSILYQARLHASPLALPDLPLQFGDVASWQHDWLTSDAAARDRAYWQAALDRAVALDLPTDRRRPSMPSYRGDAVPVVLDAELSAAIKDLARRAGVTPFIVLLAAVSRLCARLAGATDVTIGIPVANRTRRETEGLIGCFINMLPLRIRMTGELRVRDLLRLAQECYLGAVEREDFPCERMLEGADAGVPMWQLLRVMLAYQHAPAAIGTIGDLEATPLFINRRSAKCDVGFELRTDRDRIRGVIEYSVDLFERATIIRMREQLVWLLQQFTADDTTRLDALTLASESAAAPFGSDSAALELEAPLLLG